MDENTYEVVDITHTPKQVTYRHNGRSYTLQTEDVLDPVIDEVDGGLVLRGFSPEELEALGLGGNQLPGRGAQQPTGIPTDSRGTIKNGKGQDVSAGKSSGSAKPGTTAGQNPSGRPNPQARPQPANRSGLGTPQNQRGRGQQVRPSTRGNGLSTETKEQKQSRKQLEATLGIDLEKDPAGAIRQLEGLNRKQQ